MQKILHHTKKYDGGIHYRFPAMVAHRSENTLVVYRGPDVELESYRGPMISERRLLLFFYNNCYHNVAIMWDRDWTPHMHYINIATPADWDVETVTAVDLDLDIIRFAGKLEIVIDDEDEFEQHIVDFHYPEELVTSCRNELARMTEAVHQRRGVLSDDVYQWRPGKKFQEELLVPV